MANELDLSLTPMYRIDGQDQPALPGLLAPLPPRRPAKGRERDRLVVYVTLSGNVPLTSQEYSQITAQVAETFYQTSGSMTLALKNAAETANAALTERNMRTTGRGQYMMGTLILAALRDKEFYVVQSGASHVFWMGADEARHFHDEQLAGRGLGFSQNARLYFSHVELSAGDRLVFAEQMPAIWEIVLLGERGNVSPDETRRRLMGEQEANLSAVLLHATAGNGQVNILQADVSASHAPVVVLPAVAAPTPALDTPAVTQGDSAPGVAEEVKPAIVPPAIVTFPLPEEPKPAATPPIDADASASALPRHAASQQRRVVTPSARRKSTQGFFKALAKSVTSLRIFGRKASNSAQTMATRVMPGEEEEPVRISPMMMLFIAIGVPLVIIVMSVVVYNQFGGASKYNEYYAQAELARNQALTETDQIKQRTAWETTLYYLNEAEKYDETAQSQALRQEAQEKLDAIEKIVRVDYKPLGVDLGDINVSQMATYENDLYLLDSTSGGIIRVIGTNSGYTLDEQFRQTCVPGNYNGLQVGNFVDLVTFPSKETYNATVMGVDASGNLIYCMPDIAPRVERLAPPSKGYFTAITAVTFNANKLYVLDATGREMLVYEGMDGGFPSTSIEYFSTYPVNFEYFIDVVANDADLYLLRSDGTLTYCTYGLLSGVTPTRCNDPAIYVDTRPGRESGLTLADAKFTQMQYTAAPNSTLAFLDPASQAVFRFAPRTIELQDQLRASTGDQNPLPKNEPATAMTLSQNRVLFMFIDGNVYFAENVP